MLRPGRLPASSIAREFALAPTPRLKKIAAPFATFGALCFVLRDGIIALRICRPVEPEAAVHHPIGNIDAGDGADRDGALVLVAVNFNALHRAALEEANQRRSRSRQLIRLDRSPGARRSGH
jgi:hypothetical protein